MGWDPRSQHHGVGPVVRTHRPGAARRGHSLPLRADWANRDSQDTMGRKTRDTGAREWGACATTCNSDIVSRNAWQSPPDNGVRTIREAIGLAKRSRRTNFRIPRSIVHRLTRLRRRGHRCAHHCSPARGVRPCELRTAGPRTSRSSTQCALPGNARGTPSFAARKRPRPIRRNSRTPSCWACAREGACAHPGSWKAGFFRPCAAGRRSPQPQQGQPRQ